MRILAISGSLRAESKNTSVLRALMQLAPAEVEISLYRELASIPPFDPDDEADHRCSAVFRFRDALRESAAVVFSTPEYAHGMPGQLKNALDWVVGTGELSEKNVALVHASSRALYAQAALKDVLTAMNARLVAEAEVTIDVPGRYASPESIAGIAEYAARLRLSLAGLTKACSWAKSGN